MATKKSKKGKRYSDAEKQKIIDFVNNYNAANGRGGAANASKKFGVSQLTVGSWMKKAKTTKKKTAKKTSKKRASKKAARGVRRGRPPGRRAKAGATKGGRSGILAALNLADKEISIKRRELDALEAKFETLKARL